MKKLLLGISLLFAVLVLNACDSSASSNSDENPPAETAVKGSFDPNGDPDFSCVVTGGRDLNGDRWVQYRLNIPNYKGMVERITVSISGEGTQYFEETYFNLTPYKENAMCLEFNAGIAEKEKKGHSFKNYKCGNGVSYFVSEFDGNRWIESEDEEDPVASREDTYIDWCNDYKQEWENGEYDFTQNR